MFNVNLTQYIYCKILLYHGVFVEFDRFFMPKLTLNITFPLQYGLKVDFPTISNYNNFLGVTCVFYSNSIYFKSLSKIFNC